MLAVLDAGLRPGVRLEARSARTRCARVVASRLFNGLSRRVSGVELHDVNCGLKAYRREVTRDVPLYGELHRFIPLLAAWKGFAVGEIEVAHRPRALRPLALRLVARASAA